MIIGILEIEIYIYESNSLKDKRRVLRSLMERLKNKFNISIAETGLNDKWNRSIIGISSVSNDTIQMNRILSNVLEFIENDSRVEITYENIEIL